MNRSWQNAEARKDGARLDCLTSGVRGVIDGGGSRKDKPLLSSAGGDSEDASPCREHSCPRNETCGCWYQGYLDGQE